MEPKIHLFNNFQSPNYFKMRSPKVKNKLSLLFTILFLGVLGLFFFFYENEENISIEGESFAEKLQPNEWQFRQRAYPTGAIDQKAYFDALAFKKDKISQQNSMLRNGQIETPWEFCGTTNVGGRVTDIEMTSGNPSIIYVGAASGGIFKSADDGVTWSPIFDDALNLSIGDFALASSNEDIIYVGTGEPNAGGGSLAYDGNGVYKSTDGGDNWTHLGLENIGSVGKVIIDPNDPNKCFVGAMGYLFENNDDRGVFRTEDGGNSWEKVLFVNDSTGVIDMAIHPTNPDTLYAATWERIRKVDRRSYGGPSSGIYRSVDGGDTWEEMTNGLPTSSGRIGLAISESNPEVLYAFYTNGNSGFTQGIFKTTDHGENWSALGANGVTDVPYMWWFSKIYVDPTDADVVYLSGFNMHKSTNGGNSWGEIFIQTHVDQHAVCIDPLNNDRVIIGNDGGVYLSENGGNSYEKLNGLPITQFYTCELDYSFPERLYGGTQDNGTNRTLTGNVDDWDRIYGGDGFRALVDPLDNSYVYAESQYGNFRRSTNGGSSFMPGTSGISSGDRKNWNTPVAFNPNDPSILYYGANRLYKTTNRAAYWSVISPDLTTNPSQNNLVYGTITTISVSPADENIFWIGTDDGNVQVTENGGSNWSLVSATLPNRWVTSVEADPEDANSAYVTFSGFRYGENIGHVYKTTDLGNNWTDITGDLPDIPINDIIATPLFGDLYIATDIGVFYSINDGINWELLGTEMPNVVITDLDYHPPTNILLAATYGRGMYKISLEEITSIAELEEKQSFDAKAFPNPFSTQTTLKFSLENQQLISIEMFSGTGILIKKVFDGYLNQGTHNFNIDLSSFPTGIYFCTIKTEIGSINKQLKLIKN